MNIRRQLCSRAADRRSSSFCGSESGSVLIVTIWVVLVLAGLTLVFSRAMRVEAIATANNISTLETEAIARGAMAFVKARLNSDDDLDIRLEGDEPYKAIPAGKGYFWLLRPDLEDDEAYYYGIRDEAAKVNLNTASYDMLMELPNMTSELAASIIDWRDTDSDVNEYGGAEDEYYLLRHEPYRCKNDDLETVEEMLLIKGASLEILFGEDINRNGVLDANENDGDESPPDDNRNGRLDRGIYDYVTVYSKESNETSSGTTRYNITTEEGKSSLQNLIQMVNSKLDQFTVQQFVRFNFISVLDFYIKANSFLGLTAEQFRQIEDQLSTSSEATLTGLINVNTAPKEVLMCLPDITESEAEKLVRTRNAEDTDLESIAWVYDALPEKAAALGKYITINSYQYSSDIVAASGDGRAFSRYRMAVDTRDDEFDIVYWKALKHLGWPLDSEIMTKLRTGAPIAD